MDTKRIKEYLKEEIKEKKNYIVKNSDDLSPRIIVNLLRDIEAYDRMLKRL